VEDERLHVSDEAAAVIREVRSDRGGTLTITIDGGCCEGTAPHLYENYVVPAGCIEIGRFDGIAVYIRALSAPSTLTPA